MTEEQLKDAWIDADAEAVIPVLLELQFNGLFGEFEQDRPSNAALSDARVAQQDGRIALLGESSDRNLHNENACDQEDDERNHAQVAYDRVSAAPPYPLPKVMKNDIRRYFARMFMNTINSAELPKINGFFRTFMIGPCKFVAEHEVIPELNMPSKLATAGPLLMTHYVLGCFIQYPDLIMSMKDSRIVTSPTWVGSKIVMDMELRATKTHDLDLKDWIPEAAELHRLCCSALAGKAGAGVKKRRTSAAVSVPTVTCNEPKDTSITAALEESVDSAVFNDASTSTSGVEMPDRAGQLIASALSNTNSDAQIVASKKRRARNAKKAEQEAPLDIPMAYIHSLLAKAHFLPRPSAVVLNGTITLFLDEGHHVQHMSLDMHQINR